MQHLLRSWLSYFLKEEEEKQGSLREKWKILEEHKSLVFITVCLEDIIWHFSETWVIRSRNLLCIIYYLDSKEVLKRCHSNPSRKADLKGDALPLTKAAGVRGRKQRSIWAQDLSVIFLKTAWDKHRKILYLGVQVQAYRSDRAAGEGSTSEEIQAVRRGGEGE